MQSSRAAQNEIVAHGVVDLVAPRHPDSVVDCRKLAASFGLKDVAALALIFRSVPTALRHVPVKPANVITPNMTLTRQTTRMLPRPSTQPSVQLMLGTLRVSRRSALSMAGKDSPGAHTQLRNGFHPIAVGCLSGLIS
jgi:hypothetical protein